MKRNILPSCLGFLFFLASSTSAEVKLDGSMGAQGALQGPDYRVEAEMGQRSGANLFHSFEKFDLNRRESATFSGPADISRIISRVTGGTASNINGLIRSEIQGADFYMINPYGLIFGKNARLDISGSFHGTTADYLKLGNGGRFDARNPGDSVLTSAPPEAFGFVGPSSGKIDIESSIDFEGGKLPGLHVSNQSGITLVGGDISFNGGVVRTYQGPIKIVSVASVGELFLDSMNTGVFSRLGTIEAKDFAVIFSYGGGGISVQAENLNIVDGGQIYAKIFENTVDAGNIDLMIRDTINISGANQNGFLSFIGAEVQNAPGIKSGDVNISTRYLRIDNGAFISSYGVGSGSSGDIRIEADKIETLGGGKISSEIVQGNGKSGDIVIDAREFFNLSGYSDAGINSRIGTTATDSFSSYGGNVFVSSPNIMIDGGYLTSSSSSAGNSGDIDIMAGNLSIINGGSIFSSINSGEGNAGSIGISISENLLMSGYNSDGTFTNINSAALDSLLSAGGDIFLSAGSARLEKGAYITSSSLRSGNSGHIFVETSRLDLIEGARIFADIKSGLGSGGYIDIYADEYINVSGILDNTYSSSIDSEAENSGDSSGGAIYLRSPLINITDSAYLSTVSNSGNGGSINIETGTFNLLNGGSLLASKIEGSGSGGDILISAADEINIKGRNELNLSSGITTSAKMAPDARSGYIGITAKTLRIDDGGYITSSAFGSGDSGPLYIDVDSLMLLGGGKVLSAIQGGVGSGGQLYINADSSILLQGADSMGASSIISSAVGSYWAYGGRLDITTGNLTVDGGFITSSSVESGMAGSMGIRAGEVNVLGGGSINSTAYMAYGSGGDIYIDAKNSIAISGVSDNEVYSNINSSAIDSSYSSAGNIYLVTNLLNIQKGGYLSSSSFRSGDAGGINIWATDLHIMSDGHIDTASDKSAGGSMYINSGHMIHLEDSYISSSVYGGIGNGGNMLITKPEYIILDNSYIIAIAYEGNGGNIDIGTGLFLKDPISKISASSQLGIDGIINIESPNVDVNASLVNLPDRYEDISLFLSDPCLGRRSGKTSSLIVTGKGGTPDSPYSFRPSIISR